MARSKKFEHSLRSNTGSGEMEETQMSHLRSQRIESTAFLICAIATTLWCRAVFANCHSTSCVVWQSPCANGASPPSPNGPCPGKPADSKWVQIHCNATGAFKGAPFSCCCTIPSALYDPVSGVIYDGCCQLTCQASDCLLVCQNLNVVTGQSGSTEVQTSTCGGGQGGISRSGGINPLDYWPNLPPPKGAGTSAMGSQCLGGICRFPTAADVDTPE